MLDLRFMTHDANLMAAFSLMSGGESGLRLPVAGKKNEQEIQDTSACVSRRDNMFVDTKCQLPRPVGTECLLRKINRMRNNDFDNPGL